MPTDEPDELANTVQRDTDKAVETVRRQRGALYEIEHLADDADADAGVELGDIRKVS